jgi:hypothetical protein
MNLVRGEIRGRLVANGETISGLAIGESPDARIEAAVGSIVLADKFGELGVGGGNLILDSIFDG